MIWIIGQNRTSESAQSLTPFFHLEYVDENINSDKNSWYFTEDIINSSIIQGSLTNQKSNFADIFPPITTPYKFNAKHKKVNTIAYH